MENNYKIDTLKNLSDRLYQTKTVRFLCHQRYGAIHKSLFLALNISASLLIVFSSAERFNVTYNNINIHAFDFWSFSCSVLILVIGLMASKMDFNGLSQDYLSSGNEINILYNRSKRLVSKLKRLGEEQKELMNIEEEYEKIEAKYNEVLGKYKNHSDTCFLYMVYQNPCNDKLEKHRKRLTCLTVIRTILLYNLHWLLFIIYFIFFVILPFYCFIDVQNICPTC